jgi:putative transcriptional regulator
MIKHHPDHNLLTEYCAGTLDWALCLGVSTHLHFCSECRNTIAHLNSIGGSLLNQCPQQQIGENVFTNLMAQIQARETAAVEFVNPPAEQPLHPSISKDRMLTNLPKVVRKLLPKDKALRWQTVSPNLKMARLAAGQDKYEVAFHRICSGGKVAQHDHGGLEVTVVLKGSFSDGDGIYTPGDFLVRQPGEVHRPTAAQNEDCLCFSICEAPVRLTGLLGRLINPFLSVKPA